MSVNVTWRSIFLNLYICVYAVMIFWLLFVSCYRGNVISLFTLFKLTFTRDSSPGTHFGFDRLPNEAEVGM